MTLKRYLEHVSGETISAFARRTKIPRTTVAAIVDGGGTTVRTGKIIRKATNGRVGWDDLIGRR